ncbi:fibronectin type III domain-containing protein [Paenibacillus hodogayensis]|uniref:Fibronectin type III domain-containing protein n=1 Tax=Paenibacillus hodogayensis TaxID=279208 RepID=A0ABV5VS89_9BACL
MNPRKAKQVMGKWFVSGLMLLIVCIFAIPAQAAEQWSQYGQIGTVRSINAGGFNYPSGVAADSSGNIYIADSGNNRIQKWTAATGLWSEWGAGGGQSGTEAGQFNNPKGIAVDSSGNIYVADSSSNRIQKWTVATGNWTTWGKAGGTWGNGPGEFFYPQGVAVDSQDYVYVVDTYNHRIQKLTSTGDWIESLGGSGTQLGQFSYPKAIAADGSGDIYVLDENRIQKRTAAGWSEWASIDPGDGLGQFDSPSGLAVDSSGNMYVTDQSNNRIQKRSATTGEWSAWGKNGRQNGSGLGEFNDPRGVAVDNIGNVYVADANNHRIQKLTVTTNVWSHFGYEGITYGTDPGGFIYPNGVAVDKSGNVYVADTDNNRIQKRSADTGQWTEWGKSGGQSGNELGEFTYPNGVAVDSSGNVYVADSDNNRIQKRNADTGQWTELGNQYGGELGQFAYPTGVAVDSSGNVYVADKYNHRIQKRNAETGQWTEWGKSGGQSGNELGQFTYPNGVAVDSSGNVYVADANNSRIQKRNADTGQWTEWGKSGGQYGNELGEFAYPNGVAVDSIGNVYVADSGNSRIQKRNADTGQWTEWGKSGGQSGNELGEFDYPMGVAVDSRGNVYVADPENNRIQKLTMTVEPDAPTGARVEAGDGQAVVSFTTPAYDGGSAITGYTVTANPGGITATGANSPIVVTGLTNGIRYTFTVVAMNQLGNSVASEAASATPQVPAPGAPVLQSAVASNGQVTLAWNPVNGSTGYKVFQSNSSGTYGAEINTVSGAVYSYSATGLTNGTAYYFVVKATNAGGESAISNEVSATPQVPAPGAPVIQSAAAGNGEVTLAWNPVNGSTGYKVFQSSISGTYGAELNTVSGAVYSYSATGLTNGTIYYFVVKAINAGGESATSNEASATPQVPAPEAPVLQSAVAGNGQVTLAWNPVNGSTGYKVFQSSISGTYGAELSTVSGSVYSYSATGLINGTTHYFVVKAINAGGESAISNEASATPKTVPGTPTGVTAIAGSSQATISFTAPADNGGSPITGYEVASTPGNIAVTGTTSPITVTGLSNGLTYTFTVKAINSVGGSTASAVSNEVTPKSSSGNNGSDGSGNSGSGGSGGGPASSSNSTVTSTDGKLTIPVGRGGKVSLGDTVTIVIPAHATSKELKITVEKLLDYQKLLTDKTVLASPVFEILKNLTENFNKPVTVTLAFDPTVLKGSQQPVVFYYDEAKQVWVEVKGGKIQGSTISVDVDHFTKFAVFAVDPEAAVKVPETKPAISFSDIAGHWAEANIKQAVSVGIVTGYPDGTFKPGKAVTRAEFAVMLMNTLKPQGEGKALTFTDKANIGTWAQKAVAQAVQAGIIQGYEDNTFRADAEMTRAEMSTMIAKALGLTIEANTATGFADEKDIPEWAKGAVAANKKLGIVEGKDLNRFDPNAKTVRGEAVTVLLKVRSHQSK